MFSNAESAGRTEWLECVGSDDINFLNTKKILSEETQGESNKDSEADKNLQLPDLTPAENAELRKLVEKSKIPNNLNYLENSAYMKFLWQVEYEFNLPRNLLSCMCWEESR
jgi:vacuolar-type H+-ATPase subunit C/Vma6